MIHTDARNLSHLFRRTNAKKSNNTMHYQWVVLLNEFDFDVMHIRGIDNKIADYLSRYVNPEQLENFQEGDKSLSEYKANKKFKFKNKKQQHEFKENQKIFYANNTGGDKYVAYDVAGNVTNKKPLDLSITKMVFSMFLSMLLLILIFVATARTYSKSKKGEPTGLGKFTEPLVMFIKDEVALPMIGEKNYQKYMPFLLTLFFFIWINNVMGLIPFFPFSANLSGNIAFTFVLAAITFIITTVVGNKDYWKHIFWMPGIPVPMKLFLAPIEFLGIFIKPISLMIRLFANISAGHIIILSLISLIFIFKSLWLAPASLFFSVFISLIEVLVVAIQAYIFTKLSALYIGSAIEEHEH